MSQLFIDKRGKIPLELIMLLEKSAPTKMADLNPTLPDTFWLCHDKTNEGHEIKQPGEVLGSLSDVTEQLAREYNQVDKLCLDIAGIIVPNDTGPGCWQMVFSDDGRNAYRSGIKVKHYDQATGKTTYTNEPYRQDYAGYRSWVKAMWYWGIEVSEVANIRALASHIHAAYTYTQKPEEEHTTFKKPLRTKKVMGSWSPYVLSVMGLVDPANGRTFIGPEIAESLVDGLGSPSAVLNAEEGVLARTPLRSGKRTVGPAVAAKIRRAAG